MRFTSCIFAFIVHVFARVPAAAAAVATRQSLLKQMRILAKLQCNNNTRGVWRKLEVKTGHSLPAYVLVSSEEAVFCHYNNHW